MLDFASIERTILCDIRINDATQLGTDDFAGELDLDGERVMIFHKGLGGYIKTIQEDNDRLNRERLKEVKVLSSAPSRRMAIWTK